MSNELIINSTQNGDRIALLKDKKLVELHYQNEEKKVFFGDIYLGSVRKLADGLNAAFVNIGFERNAFLHYSDLGYNYESLMGFIKQVCKRDQSAYKLSNFEIKTKFDKPKKISDILRINDFILVQAIREPIANKGAQLSCELFIPGRYLVLIPFSNSITISKKIADKKERERLFHLISSIKPKNFGITIRTAAEEKKVAELDKELRELFSKWKKGIQTLINTNIKEKKIIEEVNRISSILRDIFNENLNAIFVDDKQMYEQVKISIKEIAPEKEKIIRYYNHNNVKIFQYFGIEKQVKILFAKTVNLEDGGYIIIEHTEALHVVDVNSGRSFDKEESQEITAQKVNFQACEEIARQLRLRDMGGIIVIDFIDMKKAENRRELYNFMKTQMKKERSKFNILPLSRFGLMQITRQRQRPILDIKTRESCPACNGTGKIMASIAISEQIATNLDFILKKQNEKKITLILHPYLYSFFTKGLFSIRVKWFLQYYQWVRLIEDSSLAVTDYKFLNKENLEIKI